MRRRVAPLLRATGGVPAVTLPEQRVTSHRRREESTAADPGLSLPDRCENAQPVTPAPASDDEREGQSVLG
jgi:hypothetical protein